MIIFADIPLSGDSSWSISKHLISPILQLIFKIKVYNIKVDSIILIKIQDSGYLCYFDTINFFHPFSPHIDLFETWHIKQNFSWCSSLDFLVLVLQTSFTLWHIPLTKILIIIINSKKSWFKYYLFNSTTVKFYN